jgi:hypothetical protein
METQAPPVLSELGLLFAMALVAFLTVLCMPVGLAIHACRWGRLVHPVTDLRHWIQTH